MAEGKKGTRRTIAMQQQQFRLDLPNENADLRSVVHLVSLCYRALDRQHPFLSTLLSVLY